MRDEFQNHFKRGEGFSPPVERNESKQSMLDLVPFAGGRWIMRHRDRQLFFIGQVLKLFFQSRFFTPLEPPPSAVISTSFLSG